MKLLAPIVLALACLTSNAGTVDCLPLSFEGSGEGFTASVNRWAPSGYAAWWCPHTAPDGSMYYKPVRIVWATPNNGLMARWLSDRTVARANAVMAGFPSCDDIQPNTTLGQMCTAAMADLLQH